MTFTNKLLPVALIAALVGGSAGALIMHSRNQTVAADTAVKSDATQPNSEAVPSEFNSAQEQTAYKSGFADGFSASAQPATTKSAVSTGRTTSRNVVSRNSTRRVYYDYQKPQSRSFWDKHRDKLTVAMGTGGGALIGGLIGGKKGAAIGALSGAGGSALYTYKIRKRTPRY